MVKNASVRAGDRVEIEIASLDLSGDGVGELATADKPIELRVPHAFPGERHRVRLEFVPKGGKGVARGVTEETLRGHPGRREAPCPEHPTRGGRCTGCPLMTLEEPAQRELLRGALRTAYDLDADVEAAGGRALGYRQSSKRVAAGPPGRVRLGSYMRGSHEVASMRGCVVDHPLIAGVARLTERAVNDARLGAFHERDRIGALRYVWFKTDGRGVLVTFIVADESAETRDGVERVAERLRASAAVGVGIAVQAAEGNAIRGEGAQKIWGAETIAIELAGERREIGRLGFLQPNPAVASEAYGLLTGALPEEVKRPGAEAFDLYAGAGVTTALLQREGAKVVPVESYAESARALNVEASRVEDFLAAKVRDAAAAPALVLANPPRRGLGEDVTRALRQLGPRELRLMSCGAAGLRRDLDRLLAPGAANERPFSLVSLRILDTLPQTPHVEFVVHLRVEPPSATP